MRTGNPYMGKVSVFNRRELLTGDELVTLSTIDVLPPLYFRRIPIFSQSS